MKAQLMVITALIYFVLANQNEGIIMAAFNLMGLAAMVCAVFASFKES
jgi:hypothetical protein